MIEDVYLEWIRKGLKKKGKSQVGLARAMNVAHPQITRLLAKNRELKVREIPIIADYLEELPPKVPSRKVQVVGFVGAGAEIFPIDDHELGAGFYEVEAPPGITDDMVAVEVRGDSMPGLAEDGWIVYYSDRSPEPLPDMIGRLCVVCLENEHVLIKKLYKGTEPDSWNLISTNAEPLFNQKIRWVARVRFLSPG